ncbi:MAG: hypothetical protein AAB316_07220 [Bacteroidota bacterium]
MKNLLPITTANGNLVNTETGEVQPLRYLPGYPRQIRFDASKGNFNLNGDTSLSKKGEPFSFIPVAYRIFTDDILGMSKRRWAEFFFLNQERQLCALLFHGYSVENFMRLAASQMFYDGVTPCEVVLTATPVEKVSKNPEANGNKYYLAEFGYKKLEKAELEALSQSVSGLQIWRDETTTGDARIEFSQNWNPPHADAEPRAELVTVPTPEAVTEVEPMAEAAA